MIDSRRKVLTQKILLVMVAVLIVNLTQITSITSSIANNNELMIQTDDGDIDILLLMDDTYGGNYQGILNKFQQFGWNITIAGPSPTVHGCSFISGQSVDVDVLISEIDSVTQFDCVNIMPGPSHDYLRTNTAAQNLIKNAVANGLVVSAWCRAVRVLATAGVISGKNVTGHADYQSEYESAGATFFEGSTPIIDGKIVTSVRSRFYQTQMCIAIATALGVYEANAPTIDELIVSPMDDDNYNITVVPNDDSAVTLVKVILNPVNVSEGITASKVTLSLTDSNCDGVFNKSVANLQPVKFSIDVELTDAFFNTATYEEVDVFDNRATRNNTMLIIIPIIAIATVVNCLCFTKKNKD